MIHKRKIAIVGMGPRGLSALESLLIHLEKSGSLERIEIILFEETKNFGSSPVYETHQTQTNWININERVLTLDGRPSISISTTKIPAFPSFHEWSNKAPDSISKEVADIYPPRLYVGKYLSERFHTLFEVLEKLKIASLINQRVDSVELEEGQVILQTNNQATYRVDEVLLTIGHQPTRPSKQTEKWKSFVKNQQKLQFITTPYPIRNILNKTQLQPENTIALRGFGLAMIDVVRAIAEQFGSFIACADSANSLAYQTDVPIKNLLIPFSLDGLPPSPKPLNAQIDQWFTPAEEDLAALEAILANKEKQQNAIGTTFLIDAIVPIAAKVYWSLPQLLGKDVLSIQEVKKIAKAWLKDNQYQHFVIVSQEQAIEKTMQDFVEMAIGNRAISLDFCIGQVWRHCQPSIYKSLSFNECSEEVFAKIIALDERMKRYAYGPPVESIQQLIALVEAKVMNISFLNNPNIDLTNKGWTLSNSKSSITAGIMINTVVDSPRLEAVTSPIIKKLRSNGLIQAVHDDLGVFTDRNGYVISARKDENPPIALLGRLAKGTIMGVDAILECFGSRSEQWATKATQRHIDWLK